MSFRSVLPAVACLLTLCAEASAQNQYLTFYSGSGNANDRLYVYAPGTLQSVTSGGGLRVSAGTFQILPLPDGTKYFLIANGGQAVTAVDGNFTNPRVVASNLSLAPTTAIVQPDGRRLIVAAGRVYFIDAGNETVVNPNGLVVDGTPVDIVVNFDSTRAYILSRSQDGPAATVVTMIDLVNGFATLGSISFPGNQTERATGILLGPNGMLYLSAFQRIYEIDANTLKLTTGGDLSILGRPGKGVLVPDGRYIVFPNEEPNRGGSNVIQLDLSNRSISSNAATITQEVIRKFFPATFGDAVVKLYAWGSTGRLYDVTLGSALNMTSSELNTLLRSGPDTPSFPNLSFSGGTPPATLWTTRTVTNLDGSTSRELNQWSILSGGDRGVTASRKLDSPDLMEMAFISPGLTSGGTRLLAYNTALTIAGGTRSALPLVARMVDNTGRGIYRGQISFSSANPALIIHTPSSVTGIDGWAQTFITTPTTPGTYTVSATGGPGVTGFDFTITVPGVVGPGGGGTSSGGIFISGGNGQIAKENFQTSDPLTVRVLDATGAPIFGEKVTFTQIKGFGPLSGATIEQNTDADGYASIRYTTGRVPLPLAAAQDVVEATTRFGKVTFYVTTIAVTQPNGIQAGDAQVEYIFPTQLTERNISIEAGSTMTRALALRIADYLGQPLENVGVQVTTVAPSVFFFNENGQNCLPGDTGCQGPPAPPKGFVATCEGDPLSDSRGNVGCDIRAGNVPGQGVLYVLAGSYKAMPTLNLTITVGKPSRLRILAGNGQKARSNTPLPVPFQVQVTDLGGNPVGGSVVTFTRVGAINFGTITTERVTSNNNGIAATNFRTGTIPGRYQVRAQIDNPTPVAGANPIFVVFDVEIETTIGGLIQVSGNNQETGVNSDFPNPLVVQVNDVNNAPISGFRVEFSIVGPGTLSTGAETTDTLGRALVRVKAGNQAGPITVTATVGTSSTIFSLNVRPPTPTVTSANIINTASLQPGVTPCGLTTITGSNIAPGVQGTLQANTGFGQLPTALGPVAGITIGGFSAPLIRVVNSGGQEQIDLQTPCEAQPGTTSVVINVNGQSPLTVNNVRVSQYQPGIFMFTGTDGRTEYAVAVKQDGSFIGPTNPADRGSIIRILMTGLGQTNPALATNRAGVANQSVTAELIGGINDAGVRVVKAETVPGQIGNFLVDLEVPSTTTPGPYQSVAVAVRFNGELIFSNGAYIPIR